MEKNLKIHKTVGLITAILIAITGISLAVMCVVIYKTGGARPFSREVVGEHLKYVMAQGILTAIAIITGIVLKFTIPIPEKKLRADRDEYIILKKLTERLEKKAPSALSDKSLLKEQNKRKVIKLIFIASSLVIGITALLFAILSDYNLENINTCIIRSASVVISLSCVIGALAYIFDRLSRTSAERESEAVKALLTYACDEEQQQELKNAPSKQNKELYMNIARVGVVIFAIAFIVIGIFNGGMADVLDKAVRICTECIGLG